MSEWWKCRKILCIRADNMGDVIMITPALIALKTTFACDITLLTSKAGAIITPFIPVIDQTIVEELPWMPGNGQVALAELAERIKAMQFDGVIIFTVYSQSALPAAMLAYMAGIPLRLAYARENPYSLLTHWLPDPEPYQIIRHQVERDLALVKSIGAESKDDGLLLEVPEHCAATLAEKLIMNNIDFDKPYIILHPGVSEEKRKYPADLWVETGKILADQFQYPIIISGNDQESEEAEELEVAIGGSCVCLAGELSIGEFIALVSRATLVVSVNTGTIHIAAALGTPVVVLYAQTNPQHTPWQVKNKVLEFPVDQKLQSRNTVIRYVSDNIYGTPVDFPTPKQIAEAARELFNSDLTDK